jgi:hypothetical protein
MTNQEFIALAKKNPLSFGCAVASIAMVVTLYFRDALIPEAEADLTQKTAQADRLAANIQNSAQLKEHAEALSNATKDIETRAVRPGEMGRNTGYFYKIESETGVKILDLRQVTPPAGAKLSGKNRYLPVAFSVSVQGSLVQILEFLRQIENGTHYSRTLTASLSANTTTRDALTLVLGLEFLGLP